MNAPRIAVSFEVLRIFSINKNNLGGYEKVTIASVYSLLATVFSFCARTTLFTTTTVAKLP